MLCRPVQGRCAIVLDKIDICAGIDQSAHQIQFVPEPCRCKAKVAFLNFFHCPGFQEIADYLRLSFIHGQRISKVSGGASLQKELDHFQFALANGIVQRRSLSVQAFQRASLVQPVANRAYVSVPDGNQPGGFFDFGLTQQRQERAQRIRDPMANV